jgi:hypothetical protein
MRRILAWLTLAIIMLMAPALSQAQVSISVALAPPMLPVYAQPMIPEAGYIWTPGYWAWNGGGYYWVPGTWVEPPQVGLLWTPGYWGWAGGMYEFHRGYWGEQVGFYGGVNYGYGYGGVGYQGGRWNNGQFQYNQSVNHLNLAIVHNTYNEPVAVNRAAGRTSYNGGARGLKAQPTEGERGAEQAPHNAPTPLQEQHEQGAGATPHMRYAANHGAPSVAATPRPNAFTGPGIVRAAPVARRPAARPQQAAAVQPQARPQQAAVAHPQPAPRVAAAPHPAESPRPAPAQHAAAAPHPAAHAEPGEHRQ